MTVNEDLLETHGAFEDERLQIAERFVRLELTGGTTLGVLSMPTGLRSRTGWVVCHSFGPEHLYLNATEVVVARGLAAAGFPVLRFHAQGYGDSEHVDIAPRPSTHLRDAHDAVARFREIVDVGSVGTVGCRFGATVAALVADEAGLQAVAAIDPVVSGPRYLTNLLRASVFEAAAGGDGASRMSVEDLRLALAAGGLVNVRGFGLRQEAARELETTDLARDLRGFSGAALVVQVSRGERPLRDQVSLVDALRTLGADARFVVVSDPMSGLFGDHHFRAVAEDVVSDALVGLHRSLADEVVEWAQAGFGRPREVAR
jgi:pimeloyl-ACP methyl ester carboxylesterase